MKKATVYRVGPVEVGNHDQGILKEWGAIDAVKPAAHPTGRSEAIFASPNIYGMYGWVYSTTWQNKHLEVHEIIVDAEKVYTYKIDAYDDLPAWIFDSTGEMTEEFRAGAEELWAAGMPLAEWLDTSDADDGRNAEILLAPEAVLSSTKLSYEQIFAHMDKVGMDPLAKSFLGFYKHSMA